MEWPECFQDAILESTKYMSGIHSITKEDVADLRGLFKRNPDNEFLAAYFKEEATRPVQEIPIEEIKFDELKSLYYETVCSKIGVSHGYKKTLAGISGKSQATITEDFKKLNLDEKFNNPNYNPQKRISILKSK